MTFTLNRRCFLEAAAMAGARRAMAGRPRPVAARLIVDNDFAGDPDGLFQIAHHLLSPSVALSLIVASHLPERFGGPNAAVRGAGKVREVMAAVGRGADTPLIAGGEAPIPARDRWSPSPATAAIVREAMRDDATTPLIYAAGASLTELALAWLAEPGIGRRLKLVWIGGNEYPGVAPPPPAAVGMEFNLSVDTLAAQIVFNQSDIEIWQVPRDVYRQMLVSLAEIDDVAGASPIGSYLKRQLDELDAALAQIPGFPVGPISDTYVLGDSALVTLTALMTPIAPDPASSRYVLRPTPHLAADGRYGDRPGARMMRRYTSIDADLTVRDMFSRFRSARQG